MKKIKIGSDFSGVEKVKVKYFDKYYIDKLGNVYNKTKKLKPQPRSGYLKVSLCNKGIISQMYIHRLIAITLIPNPNNLPEVNHINGIKTDNRFENLEWCSRKENAKHSYDNKLQKPQKGSSHGNSKLTEKDVLEIRYKKSTGHSLSELSKEYSLAISTTSQIINKKRWKHI